MLDFNTFIKHGLVDFSFGENINDVINKLDNCKICPIDRDMGQFGIFYNGVELLFDNNLLYLIQYEIDRIISLSLNSHYIDANTTYTQFKDYLLDADIFFQEINKDQQKILITNNNINIYFDQESEKIITVMQSWY